MNRKEYRTIEEAEYDGSWVEGICTKDTKNCPHLFICLCEEEEHYQKNKLEQNKKYERTFKNKKA